MHFAAPLLLMSLLASAFMGLPSAVSGAESGLSSAAVPRKVSASADARKLLRKLPVRSEVRSGYERELFVHWVDVDGDGCDTRREVILAEAVTVPKVGADCFITGGSWWSAYDNVAVQGYPATFDVDHLVPLAEAWDSGARLWDEETRTLFANDLDFKASLIAVTASSNRSKSDQDPAEWLPRQEAVCGYVADWVRVKFRWSLSVDRVERRELSGILADCDPRSSLT